MKCNKIFRIMLLIFITFALALSACTQKNDIQYLEKKPMKEYYTEDDFSTIKIGKDTAREVYEIAPCEAIMFTSYGGICEYPMQGGGCIRIHYYDRYKLVVGKIEVISAENYQDNTTVVN